MFGSEANIRKYCSELLCHMAKIHVRNWAEAPSVIFTLWLICIWKLQGFDIGWERRIYMPTNMQGLKIPTGYSLKVFIQNKNVEINLSDWGYISHLRQRKWTMRIIRLPKWRRLYRVSHSKVNRVILLW